jgi:methionyl-tRNA formyltransferase
MRRRARNHFREAWPNLWTGVIYNPFLQPASLAMAINRYERELFFPDGDDALPTGSPTFYVETVNSPEAEQYLREAAPDLILVYGTGLVRPHIYGIARVAALNAHGGKLPGYRGLDTNLWAILEGRPEDMTATWHALAPELDTGAVYVDAQVPRHPDLALHSLRGRTAIVCTDLMIDLLPRLKAGAGPVRVHHKEQSRYFGMMPWLLKRRADKLLREYAKAA